MRSWVEKLARLIETEGTQIGRCLYKIQCYEIYVIQDIMSNSFLTIKNDTTQEKASIKLYEEERDILQKAFIKCEEKTTDSIIEQINNL